MLRLIALVVPLALDSFAFAAALALGGLSPRERTRLSITFPAFEIAMPLIGLGLGHAIATAVGHAATYAAGAILIVLGISMLLERGPLDADRIRHARGLALIAAGVAVSLDELALGFTIGLLRLSLAYALVLIAFQAIAATQLGFVIGSRANEAAAEVAPRVAGVLLTVLGVVLLVIES